MEYFDTILNDKVIYRIFYIKIHCKVLLNSWSSNQNNLKQLFWCCFAQHLAFSDQKKVTTNNCNKVSKCVFSDPKKAITVYKVVYNVTDDIFFFLIIHPWKRRNNSYHSNKTTSLSIKLFHYEYNKIHVERNQEALSIFQENQWIKNSALVYNRNIKYMYIN